MLLTRGNDKVLGSFLLQHQPLGANVVAGVAPVPAGIKIAQVQSVLQTDANPGQRSSDLARNESFAAQRRLMIKKDAIAGVKTIRLAVIDGNPVGVDLCGPVGRSRVKGCAL